MAQVQLTDLFHNGVVAVIRKIPADLMVSVTESLLDGGVRAIEITLDSPDALQSIMTVKEKFADSVMVGAGTVLDAQAAWRAVSAGAEFIVSPNVDPAVIEMTKNCGKLSIPGAMTPSEMVVAHRSGADAVKIFPGGVLEPAFLQDVRGPLGHIPLMVTGGITLANTASFIQNGAEAVGVGSALLTKMDLAEKNFARIAERAGLFCEQVARARKALEVGPVEGIS